jgi:hypothetical protein
MALSRHLVAAHTRSVGWAVVLCVLVISPRALPGQTSTPVSLTIRTDEPLADMSKNRQGELNALTSQRFTEALTAHNVHLMTYRELIAKQGLQAMRRPAG